ncbi:MAG TPA: ADP-ribosylglycohydrolase family protein [Polyangium sp.]|nr:ADP-ribosylglycohydrolase family protein [Polyangium sp.]
MLWEIAIGDAYGAGFEFSSREKIRQHNTLQAFVGHDLGIPAGHYTDDTQMSIAVAEVLIKETEWSSDTFADAFVRCYKRDPRPGYAKGLQALLEECKDGTDLRFKIRPESRRNGAAMRSVPLGLIGDMERLKDTARAQAVITHDTREGILSAQVVAVLAHVLLHERAFLKDLPRLVEMHTGFVAQINWVNEVECDAMQTIHAVNTVCLRNRRMSDLLLDTVNFGGDVDSVAAIAMGLASLSGEYVHDIPRDLANNLESGAYGQTFLRELDISLQNRFPALLLGAQ